MEKAGPLIMLFIICGLCGPLGIAVFVGLMAIWGILAVLMLAGRGIAWMTRPAPVRIVACPDCHTGLHPVTCMTCGPARVPDTVPLAWG